ncbi:ABC transporter permease [Kitasatospora cineracea]|uniref:Monosaccharide ABC transporter membrane protein (CUT2 family) n=1 Tax=Kitasatospora cineracea TaxID=88074 RepID=A0A3N4R2T7_9ACTN|nr:ABC transporter permease [Kitasatospora cineracea]RPE27678.1 monosaccharide ABC transporter membrane protein (CUT2 family) [Kitasatospora cineracea]
MSPTLPSAAGAGPLARRRRLTAETPAERLAGRIRRHGALTVLVLLVLGAAVFSPGFAGADNLGAILGNNAFGWLLALGLTFVILTGGIDLSVGSMYALGGVLAAWAAQHHGTWAAVLLPLAVGAAWGCVHGLLVSRAGLAPFIVTLAGLLGARGLLQLITAEGTQTYLVPRGSAFRALGAGTWTPVLIAAALFGLGALLLTRTKFGAATTAIGGNEPAARLMGLPVARTKTLVYVLSATLASAAGALGSARLGSGVTTVGVGYELTAIASVAIGGTLLTGGSGSVGGTVAGVLLLSVIHNLIDRSASQYGSAVTDTVNGAFLAVVVLAQALLDRGRRDE